MIKAFSGTSEERRALDALGDEWTEEGFFWPVSALLHTLKLLPISIFYDIDEKPEWNGALILQDLGTEVELLFIYVSRAHRRPHAGDSRDSGARPPQKLGDRLMEHLNALAVDRGWTQIFLEVRVSNAPAIQFYQKWGFQKIGLRRGYYSDGEDALVYQRTI